MNKLYNYITYSIIFFGGLFVLGLGFNNLSNAVADTFNQDPVINKTINLEGMMTEDSVKNVITALNEATHNEILTIKINSPGGQVLALKELMDAYDRTHARDVIAQVDFEAASAAAAFAAYVNHDIISKTAVLMYHLPSSCPTLDTCQKINPASMDVSDRWSLGVMQRCLDRALAKNMINIQEYKLILDGRDLYTLGGTPQILLVE